MNLDPSLSSRWSSCSGLLGIRWRSCEEQSQSVKLGPVTRWWAAVGSILMTMVDLNCVGLYKDAVDAADQQEAAEARCLSMPCTAVPHDQCTSDLDELWQVLSTHGEGSVRSCLHACSDV